MADNSIVQGLFGVDPAQYQQQQQIQQSNANVQLAQLDPLQRANYSLMQGGTQLGNAGMQLLGAQDPMLKKASDLKQIASQFDTTTPEGLTQMAQVAMKAGYNNEAQRAIAAAQKMKLDQATIYQKSGENMQALLSSGKYTPESVAAYSQTRDPSQLVLIDKGLTGAALDKVSAAEQNISNLGATNTDIDIWMTKVDPKAKGGPKVTFGPLSSVEHGVTGMLGSPTENALDQDSLRRFVAREANDILQAAKGTQTEGDAKRAYDQIMSSLDKNSNAGVYNALADLKKAKAKTVSGLETYVNTMTSKGKSTTPTSKTPVPATAIYNSVRTKKGWEDASDEEIQSAISSGKIKVQNTK